jgi:hypothetical protein
MNDQFLNSLRRDPAPAFARQLKSRLNALDTPAVARRPSPMWRWLATAASFAALAFAFTFPAVRSAAEAFLDYFRVVNFAGVAFDPQRMAQLWSSSSVDLSTLIGQQVTPAAPPAPPVAYSTLDEASAAAGIQLRTPTWLPPGFTLTSIEVSDGHEFSVQGNTQKLQAVLDALGITDETVPAGLDGQTVSIQIPPVARLVYDDGQHQITLTQAKSPVVALPAGVDIASLAEIGLRLLGLDRNEAYGFAQSVDWRSTLLVPVPTATATFHQVEVQSGTGLVIESGPQVGGGVVVDGGAQARQGLGGRVLGGSLVLWSNADMVYALGGPVRATDTLQMAQSVQ